MRLSLSRTDSPYGFNDGHAECREVVQDGHADLELSSLTVEVLRHVPLEPSFYASVFSKAKLADPRHVAFFVPRPGVA
jgi:hypothetical protein